MKMTKTLAALLLALPGVGFAQQIVASTATEKLEKAVEDIALQNEEGQKASLDALFDGGAGSKRGALVVAAETLGGLFQGAKALASIPVTGLKTGKVPSITEVLSDLPGKKHSDLNTMQVGPDGTLYRMRSDRAWWRFWDSSKVIESSKAAPDGAQFNKKGEFVGDWQLAQKTKASGFKVVGDEAGKNVIYTFERKGTGTEIVRDNKYLTTLSGNDMREMKIGADDKVYARYEKGKSDVIMQYDPATKAMKSVAKIDAEYKTWQDWVVDGHYEARGHYEQTSGRYVEGSGHYEQGDGYYHDHGTYNHYHEGAQEWVPGERVWVPGENVWVNDGNDWVVDGGHYETHTSRTGVTKFEVDGKGDVHTLFNGHVTNETSKAVSAQGNIQQFSTDLHGNLYAISNNTLSVNGNPGAQQAPGNQELRVDNNGNRYWADGKIARKENVNPNPTGVVTPVGAGAAGK